MIWTIKIKKTLVTVEFCNLRVLQNGKDYRDTAKGINSVYFCLPQLVRPIENISHLLSKTRNTSTFYSTHYSYLQV